MPRPGFTEVPLETQVELSEKYGASAALPSVSTSPLMLSDWFGAMSPGCARVMVLDAAARNTRP